MKIIAKLQAEGTTLRHRRHRRRGTIFVTALGIIVILSAMVLVFAQTMRTEAVAEANRAAYIQADAIEQGAEKWVLAQCESYPGDALTITQVPAEALPVGNGYFWILTPDPTTDQAYQFGITDEAGKLNINSVPSSQLINLPNMTQQLADSVVVWRSANGGGSATADGATSDTYAALPEPYQAKQAPFETVEELKLIELDQNFGDEFDDAMLFGLDVNRDYVVDTNEQKNPPPNVPNTSFNSITNTNRGIFCDLTCYSVEPNTTANGGARINVNSTATQNLSNYLQKQLSATRAQQIMAIVSRDIRRGRGRPVFSSLGQFYIATTMTADEFAKVADKLTTSSAKTLTGLVDVNTAPPEVLACIPGLTSDDATNLVANRLQQQDTGTYAWIFNTIPVADAVQASQYLTGRSFIYSADIVAVTADGRSYKRVRIVVDARQTPAKVIYRKDLTSLGWPLPQRIRAELKAGQQPENNTSGTIGNFAS